MDAGGLRPRGSRGPIGGLEVERVHHPDVVDEDEQRAEDEREPEEGLPACDRAERDVPLAQEAGGRRDADDGDAPRSRWRRS